MILDKLTQFGDGLALNTGAAGSYIIGDVIDLGSAQDIGNGEPLWFYAMVHTAATSGGSATLVLSLCSDTVAALSSPTVIVSSPSIAVASLIAGYNILTVAIPLMNVRERYLGLQQTTGTAAFTAGKISAGLTFVKPKWLALEDAVN